MNTEDRERARFSRLLRHPARKRIGLFFAGRSPHKADNGRVSISCVEDIQRSLLITTELCSQFILLNKVRPFSHPVSASPISHLLGINLI